MQVSALTVNTTKDRHYEANMATVEEYAERGQRTLLLINKSELEQVIKENVYLVSKIY